MDGALFGPSTSLTPPGIASRLKTRLLVLFALVLITLIGAYFRFVGVNWDANNHLHPDERFLTTVAEGIRPVERLSQYFDPEESPLNPLEYGFYTYGMLPLFLLRYTAEALGQTGYDELVLVGRALSGAFDLASIWVLYLIGARLYDRRTGLLASLLYTAAVLPIQLSHFFTVDSFTTVFMLAAFYCAVLIAEKPRLGQFALFGAFTGLAMATKVSIAPLVGLALVAGVMAWARNRQDPQHLAGTLRLVLPGLAIAGLGAALFFRVFQPYAFSGPGFFGLSLNPRWLDIIRQVSDQVAGRSDFPPSHHWAGRPWSHSWSNTVLWGMGLPLGLTATFGWGWALWRTWQGEWKSHLLPVLWVGAFFFWQSSQFWRFMRYYLPVYPLAILLAAWALLEVYQKTRSRSPGWWKKLPGAGKLPTGNLLAGALALAVVAGTILYALAFTRIYRQPHTRVAASWWMLEHIPGPFRVQLETPTGMQSIPLPQATNLTLRPGEAWTGTFTAPEAGVVTGIETPYLDLTRRTATAALLTVAISPDGAAEAPFHESVITLNMEGSPDDRRGSTHVIELPEVSVEAGAAYELSVQLESSVALRMSGAAIAVETSWDDDLPLRVAEISAYPGLFQHFNLELYEPDNEQKREHMLDVLEQADYIAISSNRAYDAMPRLPLRYPMTLAYYQALFGCQSKQIIACAYPAQAPMQGDLGFELVATFESYPGLGLFSIPDQHAQESFTVYDHPKVLIFRKSSDFSLERTRAVLEGVDLEKVVSQSASQYTQAPNALRLPGDRLAAVEQRGTWSEMFPPGSRLNRSPFLAVLSWYLLLFVTGWLAFPLAFLAFRGISDRGYGYARLLGLLVVAWLGWMVGSYEILSFSRAVLWLGLGLLWALAAAIAWVRFESLLQFLREKWVHILVLEALFLGLFAFALVLRWYNPDLWHPWRGGEKPGDLALFLAVLKTPSFPPYDPWMAGNFVNYFYFGYVLAAVPTKLLGILPEIAYNLLIPTWFGLTGLGLFSLAYNLTAGRRVQGGQSITKSSLPYLAGGTALVLGLFLGNLAQARILWDQLPRYAPSPVTAPNAFEQANDALIGLGEILKGEEELIRGDAGVWYFDASRAILSEETIAPITEFPYFTFLYADLHPHLLGIPLVLASLAWMLGMVFFPARFGRASRPAEILPLALIWLAGGLLIGATYPTNTWDFPTVLGLGAVALGVATWHGPEGSFKDRLLRSGLHIGLLVALAVGLYAPFRQWFSTGGLSPELWQGPRTPLRDYLTVHGLLLFPAITYLLVETWRWFRPTVQKWLHTPLGEWLPASWRWIAAGASALIAAILAGAWLWRNDFQTAGFVILLGLWTGGLLLRKTIRREQKLALALIGAGLGLSLIAELMAIRGDVGRMNVVFKSYLQIWLLFSVAAGALLPGLWRRARAWKYRRAWRWAFAALLVAAASYTLIGTFAKIDDRWPEIERPPRTLNGLAFLNGDTLPGGLKTAVYVEQDTPLPLARDYAAFLWIRENIRGTPTIAEAHTGEYRWGARYSVHTGLPTVVGWSWHLKQHNSVLPAAAVDDRIQDLHRFYNTSDTAEALAFLEQYGVDLIVVGDLEKAIYDQAGIEKFALMAANGALQAIYPPNGEIGALNIYALPGE